VQAACLSNPDVSESHHITVPRSGDHISLLNSPLFDSCSALLFCSCDYLHTNLLYRSRALPFNLSFLSTYLRTVPYHTNQPTSLYHLATTMSSSIPIPSSRSNNSSRQPTHLRNSSTSGSAYSYNCAATPGSSYASSSAAYSLSPFGSVGKGKGKEREVVEAVQPRRASLLGMLRIFLFGWGWLPEGFGCAVKWTSVDLRGSTRADVRFVCLIQAVR
jgi:hypothetical protein